MKVEIWSDVMCPFCYIGKRKFEAALSQFSRKDEVEVVWHSFQVNPDMVDQPNKSAIEYLAEVKNQSIEWSKEMHDHVTESAKNVGLEYNFDIVKIANSFDAHRLIQLAKQYNLTDALEERFFKAYFTDGELISNHDTLLRLAVEAGLNEQEVKNVLSSDLYEADVIRDGQDAANLGVRGVPFFVLDRKYGVNGAQDSEVFLETLQRAIE
jgi:protein disulfide-isomerase